MPGSGLKSQRILDIAKLVSIGGLQSNIILARLQIALQEGRALKHDSGTRNLM